MSILKWIYDNKQWVFSGIGVIVLSCFIPGLVRFVYRKIRQRKANNLRLTATRFLDSTIVMEEIWSHERQPSNPNFDLAASTLLQTGDHVLTFWGEVSSICVLDDSDFASDLHEAAYILKEASKKRQSLSFDSVDAFWDTGEQAFSMLKTAIIKLLEYHKIPWYRRILGRKNRASGKEPK